MQPEDRGRDPVWRCPECGRVFRQHAREHSCDVHDVGAHHVRLSAVGEVDGEIEAWLLEAYRLGRAQTGRT